MRYYTLGRKYVDRGNTKYAEYLFCRGIKHGDTKCVYGLFALKMTLCEQPKKEWENLIEALPGITELAQKGDSEACFIIAKCYESGCGGEMNMQKALAWYKKSAALGCLDAAYNLGGILYFDKDNSNPAKGIKLLKAAAHANHKEAQLCLAHIYEAEGNEKAAFFWQKRASRTFKKF